MMNQLEKDRSSSAVAVVDTDEFDDEEAKMEKFYELIRSFNEARANHQRNLQQSRRQNHSNQVINHYNNGNNYQKNDVINKGTKSSDSLANFLPSFKWEDFKGVHHDEDQNQVVVSDKSGTDVLKSTSNFSEFENNVINKFNKKRKIVDVDDDDDDDDGDDDGDGDGDEDVGINNADKVKISRPQFELDLNLAL